MSAQSQAQEPAPTSGAIQEILRQRVDEQKHGVGIVVGWVDEHGSRVVNYGRTRKDGGPEVDGKTVFEIGSVSKVFTSLLLALAVEKGEMKLDDPVQKYLPRGMKMPVRGGRQITLLDLATHRSGLPRMPGNFALKDGEDPYADYTFEQMGAFLSSFTPPREAGAEFEYSNLGVGLLGNVLARVAGKPGYESLLRERICEPLGMNSTWVVLPKEPQTRLATPHKEDLTLTKNWNLAAFAGAGGIRSDAEDMMRFLATEMGFTSSSLATAMQATQQVRFSAGGPKSEIGLGWFVNHQHEPPITWHNGATGGYRSFVGFDPASRRGVVVLANSANGVDDIGFHLLNPQYPLEVTAKPRQVVAIPAASADAYVGNYQITPDFVLTFRRDGGRYFVTATGQEPIEVFPESPTDFFATAMDGQVTFVRDAQGKVTALVLHQGGVPDQTGTRLP